MSLFGDPSERDVLARELNKKIGIELDTRVFNKSDTYGTGWFRNLDIGRGPFLMWGVVVDAIAYYNIYKVQLEGSHTIWCSLMTSTGLYHVGARELNTLPLGSPVYIIRHPTTSTGTIIGVDPPYMTRLTSSRSDYINQATRSGILIDDMHQYPFAQVAAGCAPNFSGGRPLDSTTAGEWGAMTDTGLAVFLDSFMAQVRVDEETGLFLFYHDQLTRLAGHNLQIRSALGESYEHDDEGELNGYKFITPYFHESMGAVALSSQTAVHSTFSKSQRQTSASVNAFTDVVNFGQQPFYRIQEFSGYLGQGGKEVICLPPDSLKNTEPGIQLYSGTDKYVGVYENSRTLSGAWNVRSAKQVVIAKRSVIPVAKQVNLPESGGIYGDNSATDYRAAGFMGAGPDHFVTGNFPLFGDELTSPQVKSILTAASFLDSVTYAFNWEGLHPFFYHTKEWYLPEEGQGDIDVSMEVPIFGDLRGRQYLNTPVPKSVWVDHRYGCVDYYPNESYFAMLDSGPVILTDGFGSEIRMAGGSIEISAPGDIWLKSGKNVINMAGRDFIARAYNSADITTALRDIRIKAEHQVWVLGGNDGKGGVVIESKAECPQYLLEFPHGEIDTIGGVLIKAHHSYVINSGKSVVLYAYPDAVSDDAEDMNYGSILLYASKRIRNVTDMMYNKVDTAIMTDVGDTLIESWAAGTTIGAPLTVVGSVSEVSDTDTAVVDRTTYALNVIDTVTNVDSHADYDYIVDATFTYRTELQYKTDLGFALFENRWQQMARLDEQISAGDVSVWIEPPVNSYSDDGYPYPGKGPWSTESNYYTVDPSLYSVQDGVAEPRFTGTYEAPTGSTVAGVICDGNYVIIATD